MAAEARTRLALLGLLGFIVLSYAQVFVEGPYPGPTLLAIGLSTGIAVMCRRLGLGPFLTSLVSSAGLVLYLTVVFEARRSFFLLPTTDALGHLWRSISRAGLHSQIDYAPVPVRPGYVILLVVGVWVAAGWAEIATFRWRQPLLASIPMLVLFGAVLVVGTGTAATVLVLVFLGLLLTFWALESAGRVGSWGRWVATWNRDRDRTPSPIFGRLARGMVISCLASAIAVPIVIPSLGRGLVGWRSGQSDGGPGGGGASGGGIGASARVDPLVQLTPMLIGQTDQTLFEVEADEASYWRLVSLSNFDGVKWRLSPEARNEAPTGNLNAGILPVGDVTLSLRQTFRIEALGGSYLPAAATPFTIDLSEQMDRLRVHPETGDLLLEGGMEQGLSYEVWSSLPRLSYTELTDAIPGDPGQEYVHLPEDLSPRVQALLDEWTQGAKTPGEKLIAVQSHLRGFEYKLPTPEEVEAGEVTAATADYLTEFLTSIKAGYCQQFATSFALLARAMGYPSRVSVGFLPGQAEITGKNFTVRGTDAHAWPEIFFEDYGWVPFEPTPRAAAAAPTYTLTPTQAVPNFQQPDAEIFAPSGSAGANDPRLGDIGEAAGAGSAGGRRSGGSERVSDAWVKTFNRLLAAVGAGVVLVLLLLPLGKQLRAARRFRRARTPGDIVAAAFARFEDAARDLGLVRPPGETASAFAARVASDRLIPRSAALRLAALLEKATFAPYEPETREGSEARELSRQLLGTLWTKASWADRARRLWSPRFS